MESRPERVRAELVNEHFGEMLSAVRRSKGVSQAELGKRVGLSRGSISNIETGSQNVLLYQVFSFSFALNAPVSDFIPQLRDVIEYHEGHEYSDRMFLEIAKRQLIDGRPIGDDDEIA
jgi:transcriptional regulator with XRE-family HTH domain